MYDINLPIKDYMQLRAEVISTIDELNQYMLGNVTNQGAIEALEELKNNIKNYKL